MGPVHAGIGFAVVGAFGGLMLWGLGAWALKRDPGRWFWVLLAVVQVTVALQVVAGIVLLLLGRRADLLHYAYGGLFPLLLLVTGHVAAREDWFGRPAWVVFAWVGFFCFGLTLRALQTGLMS